MAITVREQQSAGDNGSGANAQISFTLGAGTQVGDLVVIIQMNDWYTLASLQTPTGTAVTTWTQQAGGNYDAGTNTPGHTKVWTGVVTTGGAATVLTHNATTDEERYAQIFVLGGAAFDNATVSATGAASSASMVAPSITPASGQSDDLLICSWASGNNGTSTFTGMPAGMTACTEADVATFISYRSAYQQLASAAATGTRTATYGNAQVAWWAVSILCKSTRGLPQMQQHRTPQMRKLR